MTRERDTAALACRRFDIGSTVPLHHATVPLRAAGVLVRPLTSPFPLGPLAVLAAMAMDPESDFEDPLGHCQTKSA